MGKRGRPRKNGSSNVAVTPKLSQPGPAKIPKLSNGNSNASHLSVLNDLSLSSSDEDEPVVNGEVLLTFPPPTFLRPTGRVADWDKYLQLPQSLSRIKNIAGVSLFKHAPLADIWDDLTKQSLQLKIEVPNAYIQPMYSETVSWFATILGFAGYKCLIEYDNLDAQTMRYIEWASFCSNVIRPLGHSKKNRIPMLPPFDIDGVPDFYEKGLARNMGSPTVAENHGDSIAEAIRKKQIYPLNMTVEAVDMMTFNLSTMRLATVVGVIGDRICVKYTDGSTLYFFNVESEFVHPLGWSHTVGHDVLDIPRHMQFTHLDPSYFPSYPEGIVLQPGQFLEIRHPIQTQKIVAAKIYKILNHGYFYVVTDALQEANDEPWRVAFHVTSPYIFPCGFCEDHDIDLVPPYGEVPGVFSWGRYLSKYNGRCAPLHLLPKRPTPKFKLGMKIEAIDEADSRFLGSATIVNIKEHLLWIHFDGWITGKHGLDEVEADKWIDFESPNIYPIGFSEMVLHSFQGFAALDPPTHPSIKYNALAESLGGSRSVLHY